MAEQQPLLHDLAITLSAPTVVLSGRDGQLRDRGTQGVLHGDLRVLNQAVVTVNGCEPEPISHVDRAAGVSEFVSVVRQGVHPAADPVVWLRRRRQVTASGLAEDLELVSAAPVDQRCELDLRLGADFAAIDVIKGGGGAAQVSAGSHDGVVGWRHAGVTTRLDAPGATVEVHGTTVRVRWTVELPASATVRVRWALAVDDPDAIMVAGRALRLPDIAVRADDHRLDKLVRQSISDLNGLLMAEAGHADEVFLAAGAPWYLTMFGRDSIWAARLLLPISVDLAAGTLRALARVQGTVDDPTTGEAPGKIPHERRRASFTLDEGHALPPLYYGTIDATSLWVCLLHDAWRWGLPDAKVRALLPALRAALEWITTRADMDDDGFAEYLDVSGAGLANQGWKDSGDAIRFRDGTIASAPVALAEVQGYHHEALRKAADLLADFGEPNAGLTAHAERLANSFRARFWVHDQAGRFPALALDAAKKRVDSPTSNIGHLLGTGILDTAESDEIGERLLRPELASGFGLRTMAADAAGYSPLSYHCGSVWPHDTAIAIRGLAASGQRDRAATLGAQLLNAAEHFGWRLPELFSGYGPHETGKPVPYPASCLPQAWSAAAAIALLQSFIGLTVDVPRRVVTVRPPRPGPLGAVHLDGLPLAGGTLAVSIDRDGTVVHVRVPAGFTVET